MVVLAMRFRVIAPLLPDSDPEVHYFAPGYFSSEPAA